MTHYNCPSCGKRYEHDQGKEADQHAGKCTDAPAALVNAIKSLSAEQAKSLFVKLGLASAATQQVGGE